MLIYGFVGSLFYRHIRKFCGPTEDLVHWSRWIFLWKMSWEDEEPIVVSSKEGTTSSSHRRETLRYLENKDEQCIEESVVSQQRAACQTLIGEWQMCLQLWYGARFRDFVDMSVICPGTVWHSDLSKGYGLWNLHCHIHQQKAEDFAYLKTFFFFFYSIHLEYQSCKLQYWD